MANVGTGPVGYTLIGTGNGASPTFVTIGARSGIPSNSVIINGPGFLSGFQGATLNNGQLLIGSTGIAPVAATLTAGTGITITNGAGTITIAASGAVVAETLTGNSGGAVSPTAGNINTVGTGSITVVGNPGTSTLTTELTGLTANAVLYGLGTATIGLVASGTTGQVLQTNTSAAPTWSTATYPSTTTINQILYSSATNTVSGLATTDSAVLTTTAAGVPVWSGTMTNGQVIIGSTGATPTAAALTAGAGVSITNAAGSITIANSTGGFTWNDVTGGSASMVVQNGYLADSASLTTLTLPATAAQFSMIRVAGKGTGGWIIAQNAGQSIVFGSSTTTVGTGGSLASTNTADCVELLATTGGSSTVWTVLSAVGNLTVT